MLVIVEVGDLFVRNIPAASLSVNRRYERQNGRPVVPTLPPQIVQNLKLHLIVLPHTSSILPAVGTGSFQKNIYRNAGIERTPSIGIIFFLNKYTYSLCSI